MSVEINPPFRVFTDVDGEPLEDGFIHIGAVNQNPQAVPISVFWDSALTIPAAQPIRTLGGYPSRTGTPSRMYVSQDSYSISVSNKNSTLIYSDLNNLAGDASLRQDLANSTVLSKGAGLVGFDRDLIYPINTVGMALSGLNQRSVESFGAVGDGVTNDTPSLLDAFAWLQDEAGRTLVFGAGKTYLQGPGDVEVMFEGNPYFPARFNLTDQNNMKIVGNGATIVADTSLTDTQFNRGIWFTRCNNLTIWDLKYDGRLDARTPFGGDAFNGGNELTGNQKSGFAFIKCYDFVLVRVKSNRTMMDGFFPSYELGFPGADSESKRGAFINCEALQNYRQGMSIVGMSFGQIIGGSYSETGTIPGKGTNPMAGIDIEADDGADLFKRCRNNTLIGVELRENRQGLSFNAGAESSRAINCRYVENRQYGVSAASTGCFRNTVSGGRIIQTAATVESATRCATLGETGNGLEGVDIVFATPHRGADFANASTTVDCFYRNCTFTDDAPATDVTALPFAILMQPLAIRQQAVGNKIRNVTGTGHAVTVDGDTSVATGNEISSVHGAAGARGLVAIAAANVSGNTGRGTRLDTAAQLAVFNIAGAATLVKQMGPNLDEGNPRIGQEVRRVGFAAGPYRFATTYDAPNLAAGAFVSPSPTFSVPGAIIGDMVHVTTGAAGAGLRVTGVVTAADTVRVDVSNSSSGAFDAAVTALNIVVDPFIV